MIELVRAASDSGGSRLATTESRRPKVRIRELMKEMLRAVVTEGTGKPAIRINGAAGKTGTSDDGRDAWFVGFTRGQVTTVWIGKEGSSDKIKDLTGTDAARV